MKWWQKNWDKVIITALILAVLIGNYMSISDCDGTIVRGVFWYECIKW